MRRVLPLLIAAAFAPWAPAAEAPRVVILSPSEGEAILGQTTIAFVVLGVEDDAVRGAEVTLDGRVVARFDAPPFRTRVDAGGETGARVIEVRVRLDDGRTLLARRTTVPVVRDEVSVRLVNLAVTVHDSRGRPVDGLTRDDFRVFDEGRPVRIERFDAGGVPLAVLLVLDTSLTMRGRKLEDAKKAAVGFIEKLAPEDTVAVLAFSDRPRRLLGFGADRAAARAAIGALESKGGTALYDAVYDAAELAASAPPAARRVAVLLSDGRDEAGSGLEPGSFHTLEEAVRHAHDRDLVVFTIGLGPELEHQLDFTGRMTTAEVLRRIAVSTGGRFIAARGSRRLLRDYREILDELRHQYTIAYTPPPARPGETFRKIRVEVRRRGVTARTRQGYYVR